MLTDTPKTSSKRSSLRETVVAAPYMWYLSSQNLLPERSVVHTTQNLALEPYQHSLRLASVGQGLEIHDSSARSSLDLAFSPIRQATRPHLS